MSTGREPSERSSVPLFPKHAFDDIALAMDEAVRAIPEGSSYRGFLLEAGIWARDHWEQALERGSTELTACNYLIDKDGIWLRARYPWESQQDVFSWHPQAECVSGKDPRESPILPFPFTSGDFAAAWLGEPACSIRERMAACVADSRGDVTEAVVLMVPDPNSVAARRALQAAWATWNNACVVVGGAEPADLYPDDARAKYLAAKSRARRAIKPDESELSAEEPRHRRERCETAMQEPDAVLAKSLSEARRPRLEWRKAMAQALLPTSSGLGTPAESESARSKNRGGAGRKALTDERSKQALSMLRSGMTAASVARRFGVSDTTIRRLKGANRASPFPRGTVHKIKR